MSYYCNFSSQDLELLKKLNDKIITEEKKINPDKKEILRLKQQILMKGMEMSVNYNHINYKPYY